MSLQNKIKKNTSLIAITIVAALVTGQDAYIFSIVGPAIDLREGPEGIREAQIFSNLRTMIVAIITHGLLLGVILVLLIRQPVVYVNTPDKETGLEK